MAYVDHRSTLSRYVPRALRISLATRLKLWRTRRVLATLDARALEDVGITPEQARREASLTVWDVPASWVNK